MAKRLLPSLPKERSFVGRRVKFSATPLVAVLVVLILFGLYPLSIPSRGQNLLAVYAIYFVWIMLAESWNLVGGYAGLLNLGLVAFFALGGVVEAIALLVGLSFILSILLAGLAGTILGVALVPTFRLRSYYFAMATLVTPLIVKPIVEFLTNRSGFDVPRNAIFDSFTLYYVGLVMTGLAIFIVYLLMQSRIGLALRAIGDGEVASSSIGINVLLYKTVALVVSGFLASVAGAYYLQIIGTVNTNLFENLSFSLFPIFMVIIGGSATFEGPIVGAIVFSFTNYYITTRFPSSTLDTLILSVLIMVVAVLMPKGIVSSIKGLLRRRSIL